jgi:2-keto-4-pentenoate hydratase
VLTGGLTRPVPLVAGSEVRADFYGLGSVTVSC